MQGLRQYWWNLFVNGFLMSYRSSWLSSLHTQLHGCEDQGSITWT